MITATESQFEAELKKVVKGKVHFDLPNRMLYSTDASIYQITPQAVLIPHDEDDVIAAVKVANEYNVPILPRGGGTSLAGQCVGESLVIDFSQYMNQILEINVEERWARVQPGVVRDQLNAVLLKDRLHFAPDPATTSRANIAGMMGNNSAGIRSIKYGKTVDHILESRCLLADGTITHFKELSKEEYDRQSSQENREAEILRGVRKLVEDNKEEIGNRFPKIMRRSSGYNIDEFINTDEWNLAKLMTGSEGTLGMTLEIKVNLEPLPTATAICVLHFDNLLDAVRAVHPIVQHNPTAVEILDTTVITMARENNTTAPLCDFIEGDPNSVLIVEFFGETPEEAVGKFDAVVKEIKSLGLGYSYPIFTEPEQLARIWTLRKSGLGLMLGMKGDKKPLAFIEDAALPTEVLAEYIEKVLLYCEELETDVAMYAHASVGLIHARPILDLRLKEDIEKMVKISEYAFELVKGYGGSWCGEHGDGLVRSVYLERYFGEQIYQVFKDIKHLFDPKDLMNPGKIVNAPPIDENLRFGTEYKSPDFMTQFQYQSDGSFASAVEMCGGVGACRQTLGGAMCPSFRATRNEADSVRGRANALRLAMTGQFGKDGLVSESLHEVFDLCLSCKSCKSECPSNVDIARLKGEFLNGYRKKHGTTLRDRLISKSRQSAEFGSGMLAGFLNFVQGSAPFKFAMEKLAGIDKRRTLPRFTGKTLSKSFPQLHDSPSRDSKNSDLKKVVLFADTFTNNYEPKVGHAAIELLQGCGYEIILFSQGCCQRPRISHGFLEDAKRDGTATAKQLDEYFKQGLKVVVLEPSCASALNDDLPDLIEDQELASRLKTNVLMIDLFLLKEKEAGRLDVEFESTFNNVKLHGHCHQKALYGTEAMSKLLAEDSNAELEVTDAGCCGMAGSFGYETEHYDISMKVGEDRLFPMIRENKDAAHIACGFSCRHQIEDATDVKPVHWVETIRVKK